MSMGAIGPASDSYIGSSSRSFAIRSAARWSRAWRSRPARRDAARGRPRRARSASTDSEGTSGMPVMSATMSGPTSGLMSRRSSRHSGPRNSSWRASAIGSGDRAVAAAVPQQRIAVCEVHRDDLADRDLVVAGGDQLAHVADDPGERRVEDRHAGLESVRNRPQLLPLRRLRGEHARDVLRAGTQHVDGEAAGVAHERQRARALLEADEREQRVERDGADGVRRQAALTRRTGDRDDGDAGGEVAEDGAVAVRVERLRHAAPVLAREEGVPAPTLWLP